MKINEILTERRYDPSSEKKLTKAQVARNKLMSKLPKYATFKGPNAANWDKESNLEAQAMDAAGKSPEEIWAATGNWKYNGFWTQEIFGGNRATFKDGPHDGTLGSQLDYEELYKAYPAMRNYQYDGDSEQSDSSGYFRSMMTRPTDDNPSGQTGEINVSKVKPHPSGKMKVTGHEGQHAVSDREGWPQGGSVGGARTKALANKLGVTPYEAYRMYSDEILANVVMNRWDMTDAERKAIMPDASGTSHIISSDPDAVRVALPGWLGGKPYDSDYKITPNMHKKARDNWDVFPKPGAAEPKGDVPGTVYGRDANGKRYDGKKVGDVVWPLKKTK